MRFAKMATALLATGMVCAQTLDNRSLTGRYYFRHLFVTSDAGGNLTEVRSLLGAITYDGNGAFTITGQQNVGRNAAAAVTVSGTYSVTPAGLVTMTNPARTSLNLNARLGTSALVGSTTETAENVFDLFVAIPAPASGVSNASLSGSYWASTLELANAAAGSARNATFLLRVATAGTFQSVDVSGHAADQRSGLPFSQAIAGAAYNLTGDGSGTLTLPASTLVANGKTLYLSRDGNILLGGSTAAGAHDFFVAVKTLSGTVNNASWKDKFWSAGVRFDGSTLSCYSGAVNADAIGKLVWAQRVRQVANPSIDFTGVNPYAVTADGLGKALTSRTAIGAGGNAFWAAGVAVEAPAVYSLEFGIRLPAVSGSGVFLHPQGVVNTASFAPFGAPISPGQFIGLFGAGLAPRTEVAQTRTFPTTLAGVQVTINNTPAPLYFVSAAQISALVPFGTQGPRATIVVNNNGNRSNAVEVAVARTAPGIFTASQNGTGLGAILRQDFSVVTTANPVKRGEAIAIYLTGLGAVSPAVPDGAPGSSDANNLNRTTQAPTVRIGAKVAELLYSGLAPGFAGLYQINVKVPADAPFGSAVPVAIETAEHFHDQVDLPIVP